MITTIGLGLLGGTLLGIGYLRGDLTFVAGGLVLTSIAVMAGAIWALRDNKKGRR